MTRDDVIKVVTDYTKLLDRVRHVKGGFVEWGKPYFYRDTERVWLNEDGERLNVQIIDDKGYEGRGWISIDALVFEGDE